MRRSLYASTAVALLALGLSACSSAPAPEPSPTPTAKKFTATGSVSTRPSLTFFAPGDEAHSVGDICVSTDGYDDIKSGAQVVITDDAGKTVGVAHLASGILTGDANITSMLEAECKFTFATAVDVGPKFFGIAVGNDSRGVYQISEAELQEGADLSLLD